MNVQMHPYYLRKMRTYFRCLDQDRSGILTREDIVALADRYQLLAKVDTIREKQARRKLMTLWDNFCEDMAKQTDLTPDLFSQCVASRDRETIISSCTQFADMLFDLIDLNADGVISLSEFVILHKLLLQNEETAAIGFKALDKENKGVIAYEEFSKAVIDFFLPDEKQETESSTIFGPLAD